MLLMETVEDRKQEIIIKAGKNQLYLFCLNKSLKSNKPKAIVWRCSITTVAQNVFSL